MKTKKKSFIFGWFSEYSNVSWPSKSKILSSLWVVLIFVGVMSLCLGFVDFVFTEFFNWVFGLN